MGMLTVMWTGLLLLAGCTGLPSTTRTAVVHELKFKDKLSQSDLSARVGDEIQWTNQRPLAVRVDFPGLTPDMLSCQRGFSNFLGFTRGFSNIAPTQSASLCFNKAGVYKYTAKTDPAKTGGKALNESGTVRVTAPTGARTRGEE
ncbi:MAG TPA: hypothetical protein VFQ34_10940 [Nitrospiraceae bacterium]|jgi:plastocyanin|nr:hypothetical protein [Nitrospiraceae bacterium]